MISWTNDQKTYMAGEVLSLCTCWQITRTDGTILRFTDHDREVKLNGDLYSPAGGSNQAATQRQGGLRNRNRDMTGILESSRITDEDLRAGRYQDAKIDVYLLDWFGPQTSFYVHDVFYIDDVSHDEDSWTATISGVTTFLEKRVGKVWQRDCPYLLGDSDCQKDLTSHTFTGEVTAIETQRAVFETDLTNDEGVFNRGKLTFTSGDNVDLTFEIKESLKADGKIYLWLPTPEDIQVGDTFTAVEGCLGRFVEDCKDKFDNVVNFGGNPHIPGTDRVRFTPDS